MIENCDWTHIIENEGIGGLVVAVVWGLVTWFKSRGNQPKSQYEK